MIPLSVINNIVSLVSTNKWWKAYMTTSSDVSSLRGVLSTKPVIFSIMQSSFCSLSLLIIILGTIHTWIWCQTVPKILTCLSGPKRRGWIYWPAVNKHIIVPISFYDGTFMDTIIWLLLPTSKGSFPLPCACIAWTSGTPIVPCCALSMALLYYLIDE